MNTHCITIVHTRRKSELKAAAPNLERAQWQPWVAGAGMVPATPQLWVLTHNTKAAQGFSESKKKGIKNAAPPCALVTGNIQLALEQACIRRYVFL